MIKMFLKIIWRTFWIGAFVAVVFMTLMGVINVGRLKNGQDPLWYIKSEVEKTEKGENTIYNLGLYDIKKIEDETGVKTLVKPSFVKDF